MTEGIERAVPTRKGRRPTILLADRMIAGMWHNAKRREAQGLVRGADQRCRFRAWAAAPAARTGDRGRMTVATRDGGLRRQASSGCRAATRERRDGSSGTSTGRLSPASVAWLVLVFRSHSEAP